MRDIYSQILLRQMYDTSCPEQRNTILGMIALLHIDLVRELARAHTPGIGKLGADEAAYGRALDTLEACIMQTAPHGSASILRTILCFTCADLLYAKLERSAGTLRMTVDELLVLRHGEPFSLNTPLSDNSTTTHLDLLTTHTVPRPDDVLAQERGFAQMVAAPHGKHRLSALERTVLVEHVAYDMTITEIAKHRKLTYDKAQRLYHGGCRKLRGAIKDGQLGDM